MLIPADATSTVFASDERRTRTQLQAAGSWYKVGMSRPRQLQFLVWMIYHGYAAISLANTERTVSRAGWPVCEVRFTGVGMH